MKQYIVQKYVMANGVSEAMRKSKRMPIHEVYVSAGWLEKVANMQFNNVPTPVKTGFRGKE